MLTTQVAPDPPRFCARPIRCFRTCRRPGIAPQLLHDIADLPDAGGPHRMTLRLQAAARVNRNRSRYGCAAGCGERAALAFRDKPKVLRCDNLRNRETVMQFSNVDIAGSNPGFRIRLCARRLHRGETGDLRFPVEGHAVGRLRDRQYLRMPAREFPRALQGASTTAAAPSLTSEQS